MKEKERGKKIELTDLFLICINYTLAIKNKNKKKMIYPDHKRNKP